MWLPFAAGMILTFGHAATAAQTAGYPAKPIRFLVGVAPGGGTDFVARLVGARLSEKFGHPVITDNRTGATGNIALELTAKAAPDGYTFAVFNIGHLTSILLSRAARIREALFAELTPVKLANCQLERFGEAQKEACEAETIALILKALAAAGLTSCA